HPDPLPCGEREELLSGPSPRPPPLRGEGGIASGPLTPTLSPAGRGRNCFRAPHPDPLPCGEREELLPGPSPRPSPLRGEGGIASGPLTPTLSPAGRGRSCFRAPHPDPLPCGEREALPAAGRSISHLAFAIIPDGDSPRFARATASALPFPVA